MLNPGTHALDQCIAKLPVANPQCTGQASGLGLIGYAKPPFDTAHLRRPNTRTAGEFYLAPPSLLSQLPYRHRHHPRRRTTLTIQRITVSMAVGSAQKTRDGFRNVYFVGPKGERVNGGALRPTGTLAKATFLASSAHLRGQIVRLLAEAPAARIRWMAVVADAFSPARDAQRLCTVASWRPGAHNWASGSLRSARHLAEWAGGLAPTVRGIATMPEHALGRARPTPLVRRIGRVFGARPVSQRMILRLLRREIRWAGLAGLGKAEVFHVTPIGAVVLSTMYGIARGGIRVCPSCGGFTRHSLRRWPRRSCEVCRTLEPPRGSVAARSVGSRLGRSGLWLRVAGRLRRRGLARKGYTTAHERRAYLTAAKAALLTAQTAGDLKTWEHSWAPMGTPGRPRKSQTNSTRR